MDKDILALEAEAGKLSPQDRARLIRRLIAGLDEGEDQDAEQLWLDEAERRLTAHHRGETESIPGDKVFGKILKRA